MPNVSLPPSSFEWVTILLRGMGDSKQILVLCNAKFRAKKSHVCTENSVGKKIFFSFIHPNLWANDDFLLSGKKVKEQNGNSNSHCEIYFGKVGYIRKRVYGEYWLFRYWERWPRHSLFSFWFLTLKTPNWKKNRSY